LTNPNDPVSSTCPELNGMLLCAGVAHDLPVARPLTKILKRARKKRMPTFPLIPKFPSKFNTA
jgi:hypothetical protein